MAKKKYLVTGGAGFIGSALVRRLVKENFRVKVLDSGLRGAAGRLKDVAHGIEMVRADIRDARAVRKACRGADGVIHTAYLNGTEYFYSKPDLVLDIGVKGMVNVIDSCVEQGVKELILLSSSEVYQDPLVIPTDECVGLSIPDPLNPRYSYAGGKIISELMTINYGRKYFNRAIVVRPHNVYGPDMGQEHVVPQFVMRMKRLCGKGKNGRVKFPIQGTGKQTRAFIFIDDFIDGLMLVLKKGRHMGIYNIGTEEEIRISEVAFAAGAYFGKKIVLAPGKAPEGGVSRRCPDITKIRRLGFRHKRSFAEGFGMTAKWYDRNERKISSKSDGRVESERIYAPYL